MNAEDLRRTAGTPARLDQLLLQARQIAISSSFSISSGTVEGHMSCVVSLSLFAGRHHDWYVTAKHYGMNRTEARLAEAAA